MDELPSTLYLMTQIFLQILPVILTSLYIKHMEIPGKLFSVFYICL